MRKKKEKKNVNCDIEKGTGNFFSKVYACNNFNRSERGMRYLKKTELWPKSNSQRDYPQNGNHLQSTERVWGFDQQKSLEKKPTLVISFRFYITKTQESLKGSCYSQLCVTIWLPTKQSHTHIHLWKQLYHHLLQKYLYAGYKIPHSVRI